MVSSNFSDAFYFSGNKLLETTQESSVEVDISVYEVFKIISSIPLFFDDHVERLENSLNLAGIKGFIINSQILHAQALEICKANNKEYGNIELRVFKDTSGKIEHAMGFIPHRYPNAIQYIQGVNIAIMEAERINPQAKIKHTQTRIKANKYLKEHSVFEVLLKNGNGEITEGSRSNVIFIKGEQIFTAPLKTVLPGITKKYALKSITNLHYKISESLLKTQNLKNVDAAFLCGTSIGILPICSINKYKFDTQSRILRTIIQEFNSLVTNYLSEKSSNF
ncbi:MAG: aminotransferase class IV [Salinivirgaceae bacterium]|jgi:branched-chain amino acid aminotransferase|nr:aminotransferase class IV [Salinivirgaceae bacterium]